MTWDRACRPGRAAPTRRVLLSLARARTRSLLHLHRRLSHPLRHRLQRLSPRHRLLPQHLRLRPLPLPLPPPPHLHRPRERASRWKTSWLTMMLMTFRKRPRHRSSLRLTRMRLLTTTTLRQTPEAQRTTAETFTHRSSPRPARHCLVSQALESPRRLPQVLRPEHVATSSIHEGITPTRTGRGFPVCGRG